MFNSTLKVVYYDKPEEEEDWTLLDELGHKEICPIVKSKIEIEEAERIRKENMTQEELFSEQISINKTLKS